MELIQHVGDDKTIVNAARVSFGGDSNKPITSQDKRLIEYLLRHKHGSPFEHNLITFKIVAPIFIARQWMRHRVGVSYNEISGRYVEVKENCYIPAEFRQQAKNNRQASIDADDQLDQDFAHRIWDAAYTASKQAYDLLLDIGVTREQARGILPQAMFTEFYFTCNVRSLLHFVVLRDHAGAQWEIQQYAQAMSTVLMRLFPTTFAAFDRIRHEEHVQAEIIAELIELGYLSKDLTKQDRWYDAVISLDAQV